MLNVKLYEILIIAAVSAVIVLPFANQAFNIDDDVYLSAAVKYNAQGFDSLKGESEQEGVMYPNYYITHPLLWPWFLAVFMELFNTQNEIALHSLSVISLILIGISSISISRRFSNKPLFAGLIFLCLPVVMLMSHMMMTDIPTLAFFLLALSLHIEGIERKSKLLLIYSGISASIACGISYQAFFVALLFLFYNYQKQRMKNISSYISTAVPAFSLTVWSVYTWAEFGIPHPFIAFQWANMAGRDLLNNFFPKFISNINAIGGAGIFPAFIIVAYFLQKRFRIYLLLSFLAAAAAIFIFAPDYSFVQKTLFTIYFSSGVFILLRIILLLKNSLSEKEEKNVFLSAWFITFFAITAAAMPLGVARYLLPCFLPLIIIVVNDTTEFFSYKKFKYAAASAIFLTILWGTLVSTADYIFFETYRDVSKKLGKKYEGQNVWFCSDGLKWYMEKDGFKPLLYGDNRISKGDFVIATSQLWPYSVPEVMEKAVLIDRISYDSAYPIRTMNFNSHAGFYDQTDALLPFSITRSGYETFSIYKIVR